MHNRIMAFITQLTMSSQSLWARGVVVNKSVGGFGQSGAAHP